MATTLVVIRSGTRAQSLSPACSGFALVGFSPRLLEHASGAVGNGGSVPRRSAAIAAADPEARLEQVSRLAALLPSAQENCFHAVRDIAGMRSDRAFPASYDICGGASLPSAQPDAGFPSLPAPRPRLRFVVIFASELVMSTFLRPSQSQLFIQYCVFTNPFLSLDHPACPPLHIDGVQV